MKETQTGTWTSITHSLETAVLLPQHHDEIISHALQHMLTSLPAVGTALIWPCHTRKVPWKVYYVGSNRQAMHRWLSSRLHPSLDSMIGVLQHDLAHHPSDMPPHILIRLNPRPSSPGGLWILWADPSSLPQAVLKSVDPVQQTFEAMLEVEERQAQYFSANSPLYDRELVEALAQDDPHALSAFLSLTRLVAQADFTFWARAYDHAIEVTSHLGAKHSGFGFALPRGHGMGGRVAAFGKPMVEDDYRNSPYRAPSVSEVVDAEEVRSVLALPVCYYPTPERSAPVAAVLYATRRTVNPFSHAERLLMQRQANILGQLTREKRSPSCFFPSVQHLPDHKAVWHNLVLHANRIEEVEVWAEQLIKGRVIVTNSEGSPYVFAHVEELEQMRAAESGQPSTTLVLSLTALGVHLPGQVYLCPSIPLPPPQWPDFFADLIVACNSVIARMERRQDEVDRQREQWLRRLLQEKVSPSIEQDGYHLGLPVEQGQLWVLAWPSGSIQASQSVRKRMIAERVVLEFLKSPLIFFEDEMAVVLLKGQPSQQPSQVRDALLKHGRVHPIWIVYGGRYYSSNELKTTLTHTISLARKARREEHGEYLLDIYTFGLDSLWENPKLAQDLDAFASKLLTPLIEQDATAGSHLTETFVLSRILGSAQTVADQLGVHINTIRNRLHRAEEILGTDQASEKEQAAMTLAAFTWQRFHQIAK